MTFVGDRGIDLVSGEHARHLDIGLQVVGMQGGVRTLIDELIARLMAAPSLPAIATLGSTPARYVPIVVNEQTDRELRARLASDLRSGSHGPQSDSVTDQCGRRHKVGSRARGIEAGILSVPGVTAAHVIENCSDEPARGMPPHSVHAIVAGGDQFLVSQAIGDRLPPGVLSVGDRTGDLVIPGGVGFAQPARFSRPKRGSAGACIEHWGPGTSGIRTIRLAGRRRMLSHELATLAMLYDDHPGKHNRHSSTRWMRRFADVAAVAGDALEMGDRPLAIRVLCEMVPLEEALKLTRDHQWVASHDARPRSHELSAMRFVPERIDNAGWIDMRGSYGAGAVAHPPSIGIVGI